MEVQLRFLEAGSCTHPEKTILPHGGWRSLRFPATVAVIEHPTQGVVLFDTGYSADFNHITRRLPEKLYALATPVTLNPENLAVHQLKRWGIQPKDVRHVICSHFHADHVGGLRDFPYSSYIHDLSGYTALKDLSRFQGVRRGFLKALIPADFEARSRPLQSFESKIPLGDLGSFAQGTDLFGDGSIVAVPLPGHAAGHIGIRVRSGGKVWFLVSDACWVSEAFEKMILPSFLTRLLMEDFKAYGNTLQGLHELHRASPEIRIVPCHCERAIKATGQFTRSS